MCTNITESAKVAGSGRGQGGWITLNGVNVSYDHPFHAPLEYALNIDFVNDSERIAVELTADSARRLVDTILLALERGAVAETRL